MSKRTGLLTPYQMVLAYVAGGYGFGFQGMSLLLVPLRAAEIGVPVELVGLLVGAGALGPTFLSVPAGAISDQLGARRTYVITTFLSGVMALGMALTDNLWAMLAVQLLLGTARGSGWVASQSYVSGLGTPEQQPTIMGRFSFASNVGTLGGPLLAGAVAQVAGYPAAFVASAGVAWLFTLNGLLLPDTPTRTGGGSGTGAGFGTALTLLRLRGMQVALIMTVTRLWIWSSWLGFFPLFLRSQGMPPGLIGVVVSFNGVVATVVALGARRAAAVAGTQVATATGLALGGLAIAVSPHVSQFPWVLLPALLVGAGSGITLPLLMAVVRGEAPVGQRGVAAGVRTSANQASSAVAPMVVGPLVGQFGLPIAFALCAAMIWSFVGAAMWLHLAGPREEATAEGPAR